MAVDYAKDRIHINCLCPGFVESPMIASITADPDGKAALAAQHPWNALGRPEDIADAALFLASDEASVPLTISKEETLTSRSAWVTGHSMVIDGAYTCQ